MCRLTGLRIGCDATTRQLRDVRLVTEFHILTSTDLPLKTSVVSRMRLLGGSTYTD